MPLFEYECPECKETFEKLTKSLEVSFFCWYCNSQLTKKVSKSSFSLKGGGWYQDNYGTKRK